MTALDERIARVGSSKDGLVGWGWQVHRNDEQHPTGFTIYIEGKDKEGNSVYWREEKSFAPTTTRAATLRARRALLDLVQRVAKEQGVAA